MFHVYVCGAECMYVHHRPAGAGKGQMEALGLLELEAQVVVGCQLGSGKSNLGLLQGQEALQMAERSLQP